MNTPSLTPWQIIAAYFAIITSILLALVALRAGHIL